MNSLICLFHHSIYLALIFFFGSVEEFLVRGKVEKDSDSVYKWGVGENARSLPVLMRELVKSIIVARTPFERTLYSFSSIVKLKFSHVDEGNGKNSP